MRHFPIFIDLKGQRVVVAGDGEVAVAKLRLLLKTEAKVEVFGANPVGQVDDWVAEGRIALHRRAVETDDIVGARLVYAAYDDADADARVRELAERAGVLCNVVDNLDASAFITPAIVDRDPVTVAIGTEGTAPVLARRIKADIEAMLPTTLGVLARIGAKFRQAAEALPGGAVRRAFWARFFYDAGPRGMRRGGREGARAALEDLLIDTMTEHAEAGSVALVGAGPGDPELLTRRAARLLHEADVVIHDRLVSDEVLELARREAVILNVGKKGFGPSWSQSDINENIVAHARAGQNVVRLKGGDPAIFARLDEEVAALREAGIDYEVVPGITAASGAVAALGQSLTRRGRNSSLRILTGHDIEGFADHDWRGLAQPGETAAIYMGKRAAKYLRGRLLMFGADGATPVTVVENATRSDQRIFSTTLRAVPEVLDTGGVSGPAVLLYGIDADAARGGLDLTGEERVNG